MKVVTAHDSIERAVDPIENGACDFVTKPVDAKRLEIVIRKGLERESLKRSLDVFMQDDENRHRLIAENNQKMNETIETAQKAALSDVTVLLLGERGTGKEVFARAIHRWSDRRDKPFIAIDCVALSKGLFESELFGHEKNAFNNAQLKKGKLEEANGGTVFLDETGDIPLELQPKLLRFLQEHEFERVGGIKKIRVDVRVIAATNQNLEVAMREGRFRGDFYDRLNEISITIPPLRERREDIPALCHHFLQRYSVEAKKNFIGIEDQALERLSSYHWPGNVRELANAIKSAVVLGEGPKLTVKDLKRQILAAEVQGENLSYREATRECQRKIIQEALDKHDGRKAKTAKSLGLHEKYLSRLVKALGIT
jgi:DNA-binding NtrC family response regulator